MTKSEFIKGIEKAQRYLQKRYEETNLYKEGCCRAIGSAFGYHSYPSTCLRIKVRQVTGNENGLGYYLGDFTDENLFKRMMVLECLMEEMINDGSYKEL